MNNNTLVLFYLFTFIFRAIIAKESKNYCSDSIVDESQNVSNEKERTVGTLQIVS